jgi:integral membrane protein (TIGR01906 family)
MKINRVLQVLLSIILPFLILMGSIRLLITPGYARFEYNRVWFPKDPYGMTKAERLHWSKYAITYLTNDEDISYLGDSRFDDGSEVFNERELEHMLDVKKVVKTSLSVWYALIGFFFASMMWFSVMGIWKPLNKAIIWGSWLSIGLIVAILIFLAISFNQLFEKFHQLFFKEGSWLFYQDDTLIRLFPLEFWRDAFIIVCLLSILVASTILIVKAFLSKSNKNKAKATQ